MYFNRSKYNNQKVRLEGYTFDSKKEAKRWEVLKLLKLSKQIENLIVHPIFTLQEGFRDQSGEFHRSITYEADFQYFEFESGKTIIEDVKASKALCTDVYKIKKKLLVRKLGPETLFREFF